MGSQVAVLDLRNESNSWKKLVMGCSRRYSLMPA